MSLHLLQHYVPPLPVEAVFNSLLQVSLHQTPLAEDTLQK